MQAFMNGGRWSMSGMGAVLGAGVLCAAVFGAPGLPAAPARQPVPPTLEQVVTFDPALGQLPESITSDDDGNLYASTISGVIFQIPPDHSLVPIATLPLPTGGLATGIKLGPDGALYVGSASFTEAPAAAFIWRIELGSGEVEPFATLQANGFPNDLAFDDDGNLFVTDPFLGQIWQIDPCGDVSVFLADPRLLGDPAEPAFGIHEFGVDGIAFDADKSNLYVSNVDRGTVFRIPRSRRGRPQLIPFAEAELLKGVDGIAFDRSGTLYAAVNPRDRLATVDRRGHVALLVEGPPLDGPSSFAFGTGRFDRRTLYVANFAINRFLAGEPANPGILSLRVRVPGLALP